MLLQKKNTSQSRVFSSISLGIFLCLIFVLLMALFFKVSVVLTPTKENATTDFLLRFLKIFSLAGLGFFTYSLYCFSRSKNSMIKKGGHSNTGFVLNTFEGLIQELKIKEEELERLKKEAEDRAKHIESYNENILQSVPSGVLTFNQEKTITTFNTSAGRILNLDPKMALQQSYQGIFEKNPKLVRVLDRTLEEERDMLRQDCAIEFPDGKKVWLGLSTSLLRDRENKMIGATLVFTDLTEKKMLEEQVELKKRLVMMGEMSAWVAHEFRSYMGTILGFSRLLGKKLEVSDPGQSMIQSIADELSSMEHLISELLSYSKKTIIEPTPIVLTSLLQGIKDQFVKSGKYPNITWILSFEEPFPEIKLDAVLMRQAFTNLVQNALDAMEGEGELKMKGFLRSSTKRVQIEISDTGDGISGDALDKVFLPFFTTKTKGTGLGLALVHKIVLSHNGHITVESHKGQGTLFSIILPINRDQIIVKEPEWKQF